MSKRLIIALLATVALAAGLTACKPKEESSTTTVTPESTSTTTTTPESTSTTTTTSS